MQIFSKDLFPRALEYQDDYLKKNLTLRESGADFEVSKFSERHLQCVWYDPKLRPPVLKTSKGLSVHVEHPGHWNLEAGPDFLGAVIRVGTKKYSGDVEIHRSPNDWIRHGHDKNPRYKQVAFHVTYYPGAVDAEPIPKDAFQIFLRDALDQLPYFSFEQVDLSAYPYEIENTLSPLRLRLEGMDAEAILHFLDAAGEERLRKKSEYMLKAIDELGEDQVLYEEVMVALGYKHNKFAFRKLAKFLPLAELRDVSKGDPGKAYALLLGVSGLIPKDPGLINDPETVKLIRSSWDFWWKCAAQWEERIVPRDVWWHANVRPTNHPIRRMMAAAYLFTEDELLSKKIYPESSLSPVRWRKRIVHLLNVNTQTYWTRRLSLSEKKERKALALIGKSRAISILNNVFIPFLLATKKDVRFATYLPMEPTNQIIRQTAHALFGPAHSPKLYDTGLRRQGLIQVFQDFGM